ncbi:hypothetical protein AB0H83_30250 [Dactylosporangium sp. NPDC050688]|uniref:hypothetical protein n=1 Tax=Dactylosporangium sp. NPDC050688 TaxID=3157217 RepID=UPI0033E7ECAB
MDGAEARRLFERFRLELWHDRHWDSEFTPSPHAPGAALRELVDVVARVAPHPAGDRLVPRWLRDDALDRAADHLTRVRQAVPPRP